MTERDPAAAVADNVVALMCSVGRAKAQMMAAAADDVEWPAQILLRRLARRGPMRASALADWLGADPSTVSRQVAALVKAGLVERRADAEDGRASILALTPKADRIVAAREQRRAEHFATLLADWSSDDLTRFAELLARFTADYGAAAPHIDTAPASPGAAEGKG
jgi:DNA-binding MarR family transcriptional regulator